MSTKTVRRTQVERRDESGTRMMEAAVQLIAERGIDALTLADVGVMAGYSRGLPAHHFGSKENFQEELGKFIIRKYNTSFSVPESSAGLSGLIELLQSVFEICQLNEVFLRSISAVLSSSQRTMSQWEELEKYRVKTMAEIEGFIGEGIRKGEVRSNVDPKLMSLIIVQSMGSVIESMIEGEQIGINALADNFIALIQSGLAQ